MFSTLFAAVKRLGEAINRMASVFERATDDLELRLSVVDEAPRLPAPETNGRRQKAVV